MYIAKIPNRRFRPTYLLRESFRQDGRVRNRTPASLTYLPLEQIERVRLVLKGERLVPVEDAFRITRSLPQGHVHAVLTMLRRLGLERSIASWPCRPQGRRVGCFAGQGEEAGAGIGRREGSQDRPGCAGSVDKLGAISPPSRSFPGGR